jgi:predicted O-methyltransferase YrrM
MPLLSLARRLFRGHRPILIDFVPKPRPRWGYGSPPHALLREQLERGRNAYRGTLEGILAQRERLRKIPARGDPAQREPYWINGYLPGLDAAALYTFIAARAPRRYVEIGSGHSTRFAARAIRDHGLGTTITTVDPAPRASVKGLADTIVRARLEDHDPSEIAALVAPGDVLFFDGSHRALENSDVTVFFLEIVPRLAPGVLVEVHDICLPDDYPPGWEDRWYSEQYLLAAFLLGGASGIRIVLPNAFVSADEALRSVCAPVWDAPGLDRVERRGSSFWFETIEPAGRHSTAPVVRASSAQP